MMFDTEIDTLDRAAVAVSQGEWPMPELSADITDQWRDSFIAIRLADVLARRYFGQSFQALPVRDRVNVRSAVETWVEEMTDAFGITKGRQR